MSDAAAAPSVTLAYEPKPAPAAPSASARSFVGHAKLIGGLTLVSRILGLGREVVAGHYLGTGLVASAFTVAFTVPNLFRKLFGEGALSAAFIPLYAKAVKGEQQRSGVGGQRSGADAAPDGADSALGTQHSALPQSALSFAVASVNLLCAILLAVTLLGEAALAAWLWLDRGMTSDTALTVKLTMVMLPYVLLICGGAFLSGILQVHRRFAAPAFAPVLLNVIHIAVVFTGAWFLGLRGRSALSAAVVAKQTTLAYLLGVFVLVAGVLQVLVLVPGLRAAGFRFRFEPHFWTPAVKRMLKLTVPVALGAGVLQLSVLLDKGISVALMQHVDRGSMVTHFDFFGRTVRYPMELGAPARLNLAQFLYQFPLGVFAIALATAIFPGLSSDALDKDKGRFRSVLRTGVEATLWEGIPASVGLILVRDPAIRLLFQHGQITSHDAELISRSVLFYAGGIWAFSLLTIINRAYYALHDTVTPLVLSGINLLLNLAVEIPLIWWLGEAGMAVGTLVSFALQAVVMLFMLDRRIGGMELRRMVVPVLKMLLGTAAMTAVLVGLQHTPLYPKGTGRLVWATQLTVMMVAGGGVYLMVCAALGLDVMKQMVPKRFRRSEAAV